GLTGRSGARVSGRRARLGARRSWHRALVPFRRSNALAVSCAAALPRSNLFAIRISLHGLPKRQTYGQCCLVTSALRTRRGGGERQAPVRACGSRARAGARERAGSAPRIPGAGAWPAATAPAPAAGCGGAAHGAFLARARGKVPHSTARGSAPWKLAAQGAAKFQRIAAQPGVLEVGRAGRGEVPTQRRAAS